MSLSDPANYRPITLLSSLSKIFASLLCNRLTEWADLNNIISNAQAGFRKNYSTIDNIFVLQSVVTNSLSKKRGKLFAAFVDFKAAFDSVDRDILFRKLRSYNINGKFLNILLQMYCDVKACIKLNDNISDIFSCKTGVRQGCVLSPLLFSLFINDIEDHLRGEYYKGVKLAMLNCFV